MPRAVLQWVLLKYRPHWFQDPPEKPGQGSLTGQRIKINIFSSVQASTITTQGSRKPKPGQNCPLIPAHRTRPTGKSGSGQATGRLSRLAMDAKTLKASVKE